MDKSTVFNLLESKTLHVWREQVKKADECGYFAEAQKLTEEIKIGTPGIRKRIAERNSPNPN